MSVGRGSPAEAGGVTRGMRLARVNGRVVAGLEQYVVLALVRGSARPVLVDFACAAPPPPAAADDDRLACELSEI